MPESVGTSDLDYWSSNSHVHQNHLGRFKELHTQARKKKGPQKQAQACEFLSFQVMTVSMPGREL